MQQVHRFGITAKRLFIFLIIVIVSYMIYIPVTKRLYSYAPSPLSLSPYANSASGNSMKIILCWTPFFGTPMGNDYLNWCPLRNSCFITSKQSDYENAHALVFHPKDMNLRNLPPKRHPAQIYVFLSHESPPHTDTKAYEIKKFFNWTMTYRLDSDIPYPYSYIVKGDVSMPC